MSNFYSTPVPDGHALLRRSVQHCRRTKNGAWVANGSTENTELIPLDQVPGRLSYVGHSFIQVKLSDGSFVSLCGANQPVRSSGFGALAYVEFEVDSGKPEAFRKRLVNLPHPLLPVWVVDYYGLRPITPFELSTARSESSLTPALVTVKPSNTLPRKAA